MSSNIVITTKDIVNRVVPILHVIHDDEGDWQVLGGQSVTEADAMVISLDQVLQLDASVKEVTNIPTGFQAWRSTAAAEWQIGRYD